MGIAGFTQLSPLGAGAFGQVVLARHDASGAFVAIKYLYDQDPAARAWFRHEAAILQRVASPHVARLYEFVESADGAAIVMEAVPGVPLSAVLAEGVLSPESALTVLKGSLLGLAAAHQVGAVHRDYKPGNVLVQPDRQSKLVDFGIAVLAGQTGMPAGTPNYQAPEQWAGAPATPATDVYAATCVFFRCVTGHPPFAGDLRQQHQLAPIPVGAVPEPLRPLIAHGMAKHPGQRPPTAWEFVAHLDALAATTYGADWEARGWNHLAPHAATLLSLTPLATLATTSTALTTGLAAGATASTATAGAAGAATTAAGTAITAGTTAGAAANTTAGGVAAGTATSGAVGAGATTAGGTSTVIGAGSTAAAAANTAIAGTVGAGTTSAAAAGTTASGAIGATTAAGASPAIAAGTAANTAVAGTVGAAATGTTASGAIGAAATTVGGASPAVAAGTATSGAVGAGATAAGGTSTVIGASSTAGAAANTAIAGTVGAGTASAAAAGTTASSAIGAATTTAAGASPAIAAGTAANTAAAGTVGAAATSTTAAGAAGTTTSGAIGAAATTVGGASPAVAAGTAVAGGAGVAATSTTAGGVAAGTATSGAVGAGATAAGGTSTVIGAGSTAAAAANTAVAGTVGAGTVGAGTVGAGATASGAIGTGATAGSATTVGAVGAASGSGAVAAGGASGAAAGTTVGGTVGAGTGVSAAGATVAGGAGATGVGATATGVGAATGTAIAAKVVIGIIAAAAVAGTTVVVVDATSGDAPGGAPATTQVAAAVQTRDQSFPTFTFNGQVVQVSGIADQQVATKVNQVLAKPVDDWISFTEDGLEHPGLVPPTGTPSATSKAQIIGQTDRFVSVRYDLLINDAGDTFGNHGGYRAIGLTVDLGTGTELTATQAFPQVATTPDGAAALDALFTENAPQGLCEGMEDSPRSPLQPDFLTNGFVQVMFADKGVRFLVYPPAFGYAMACDQAVVSVPYDQLKPLMDARAVALIPGG